MEGGAWRLQSKRSQRLGHDWATSLSLFTYFQLHQFAHTFIISLTLLSLTSLLFFFFKFTLVLYWAFRVDHFILHISTLLDGSHIESSKFIYIQILLWPINITYSTFLVLHIHYCCDYNCCSETGDVKKEFVAIFTIFM